MFYLRRIAAGVEVSDLDIIAVRFHCERGRRTL